MAGNHDELISSFVEITSAPADQAAEYLAASGWDLEAAAAAYFADVEEEPEEEAAAPEPEPEPYAGPRTLDGRPAPDYARSSVPVKPQKKKGLATLSSLGGGHAEEDDDDDDDEDYDESRGPRDLFAGGEKSGLAVQDPAQHDRSNSKKLINDIIAKAKSNASHPETQNPTVPNPRSSFRGSGQTLGGDGTPSRTIPNPRGEAIRRESREPDGETQERILHLWNNGFSIDDGPLRRFDDPQNAMDLNMIRQGRAPLHLMNVRLDQPVDVKLQQHSEDWHQLPRVYRPFGGEGRRLGSPVPGDFSVAAAAAALPVTTTQPAASTASQPPSTNASTDQPTLLIRIQLPDGTRLPARFNTTQTIDDVYQFVERASPATLTRSWVLATTFPNKDHTDRALVLGEMPEFSRGGTAVVKWA